MQAIKTKLDLTNMIYFRCFSPMDWRHFCLQDAFVWFCSVKRLDIDTGQTKFLHAPGESCHKSLISPFFDLSDRQSVPHSDATHLDTSLQLEDRGTNPSVPARICPAKVSSNTKLNPSWLQWCCSVADPDLPLEEDERADTFPVGISIFIVHLLKSMGKVCTSLSSCQGSSCLSFSLRNSAV